MSGWCLGNLINLSKRERFFCILAGSLHDLDGVSILAGEESYWDYHHVVGHNFLFGLVLSGILAAFSKSRVKAFFAYITLFHIHLVMDYYGSGPGWGLSYFWPFSKWSLTNPDAWPFYSWQNIAAAGLFFVWTLLIIFIQKRTPLEWPMPSLDHQIVELVRKRHKKSNGE